MSERLGQRGMKDGHVKAALFPDLLISVSCLADLANETCLVSRRCGN